MRRSSGKLRMDQGLWHSVEMRAVESNLAKLSARLDGLFPAGARAAELREPADAGLLLPAEAQFLGRAVPSRVQEFAAGRLCARRLLAEFGIMEFPLIVSDDRQPIWPATLVGSITHTRGFCAAVVAPRDHIAGIGIDCEVAGGVKEEFWPHLFTATETPWLRSLPNSQQAIAATLIFSAKEAFYKCQYPLVGERLGFGDAAVEVLDWGAALGEFVIHTRSNLAIVRHAMLPLRGRYLFHEEFISTGMAVRNLSTPCRREIS
jgi:4'-phosphopantetheinyl transferase EntD